jgi:hypothetical protein
MQKTYDWYVIYDWYFIFSFVLCVHSHSLIYDSVILGIYRSDWCFWFVCFVLFCFVLYCFIFFLSQFANIYHSKSPLVQQTPTLRHGVLAGIRFVISGVEWNGYNHTVVLHNNGNDINIIPTEALGIRVIPT